jgi:hypothetical protein
MIAEAEVINWSSGAVSPGRIRALDGAFNPSGIDVANRGDFGVGAAAQTLYMIVAPSADTDDADVHAIVCA